MSANIPSTMPMSDLLKSTGYNCPEELQGKTFDEATSGSDTKISTNTDKTIDVSTYTEPVEIEPAEGYDATKKATVTLSNIPVLETNKGVEITSNGTVEITPTEGNDAMEKVTLDVSVTPAGVEANKTVTISKNGTVEITPTSGNSSMAKVTATVDVRKLYCFSERNNTGRLLYFTTDDTEYIYNHLQSSDKILYKSINTNDNILLAAIASVSFSSYTATQLLGNLGITVNSTTEYTSAIERYSAGDIEVF